ncbi:MAG: spore coat protein YlbD [Bacilli bacterium]|jgi:hypothetical protein
MKKIDEFKLFVKSKPVLIDYVKNNEMTWQKFYELWDLYGPEHNIWNSYYKVETNNKESNINLFSLLKNIDTESLKQGIIGLQKGIGIIQELINKETKDIPLTPKEPYQPRPLYKRFDD